MTQKSQAPEVLSQANKSETPVYEVGFHIVPTVQEDGVAAVVEKVRAILDGAEIISEQFPARMTLAYTVERSVQGKREKYQDAYFGFMKFALEREAMPAFQVALRAMPEVLRFLVIETVREDAPAPRRVVFTSRQLEGETIKKPEVVAEKSSEVSEEELNKSIDALVSTE
jgi:ribosomal protein S6